jgi:hypothetical protein
MYLLNDGKTLELTLTPASRFTSREERAAILDDITHSNLPLAIRFERSHTPGQGELLLITRAMQAVRESGRSFRMRADEERRNRQSA